MRLCRTKGPGEDIRVGLIESESVRILPTSAGSLASILASADPASLVQSVLGEAGSAIPLSTARILAPIDHQEVWAAGVTYKRSQKARMDESESAAVFYDRVYSADRPEIFFKATPHRVSGPGEPVRVRQDTKWTVPEPELALVISPKLKIVGYTVGNDMSARDIEGENPLYLPQAKLYDQCCALGPYITLASGFQSPEETTISLTIERGGDAAFKGETKLTSMNRKLEELVQWLGRDNSFPHGAFLLTGTGIVPPDDFSLEAGDLVSISITGIGTLINPVVRG